MDAEVGIKDHRIRDVGALRWDGAVYHSASKRDLTDFLKDVDFVCGHNIINHDAKYLFGEETGKWRMVDTLYVSPLLFPEHPYHRLLKDDKLMSEQLNNPVNDCEKARDLLMDEAAQWERLSSAMKTVFATLLQGQREFEGFLAFVDAKAHSKDALAELIRHEYNGRICEHSDLERIIMHQPCELAYTLALIATHSDMPIAQLSQKMQSELRLWAEKGYHVIAASIRFIVAWRPKEAPKEEDEHAILLIDLMLKRNLVTPKVHFSPEIHD